jgi:hypothetical protein
LSGSFWPSAQGQLLLQAALFDDERGVRAWDALRPQFDIERLEGGSLGLLPFVYEHVSARDPEDPILGRLRGVYRYTWSRNQLGLESLVRMLATLHESSVETVLLGEAALISEYYRRLGVRALDEPAILVRPSDATHALGALTREGWTILRRTRAHWLLDAPNTRAPIHHGLQLRVLAEEKATMEDVGESMWDARGAVTLRGVQTAALDPTHELLRTCVGGARSARSLLWIVDAVTIARTAGQEIDWNELVAQAVRLGSVPRVRDALRFLADELELPVPGSTHARLAAVRTTRRERLAHRIAGRGGHVLGNLPATVATHLVATRHEPTTRALLTLPRFVREEWGLERIRELPSALVSRVASRASLAWRRARARA